MNGEVRNFDTLKQPWVPTEGYGDSDNHETSVGTKEP